MSHFLCDTSCLVASACGWHEHHSRTVADIERRVRHGEELVIASHSLVEAYAVLTRLPPPNRLATDTALALIEANWKTAAVVHLNADDTWRALRNARRLGMAGGQAYDAVIAASAEKAGASTLLTWNVRHFARFANGMRIVAPR